MTKIIPVDDRLVVEPIEEDTKTASGLYIPDTGKEKPQKGKVTAVGPGKFDAQSGKRIPLSVKVGDTVLFTKYGPTEIKIGGKELFFLNESDVLAIVE